MDRLVIATSISSSLFSLGCTTTETILDSDKRIEIHGSEKEVDRARQVLTALTPFHPKEGEARLTIQEAIVTQNLKARILFDGNTVWDPRPIRRNLIQILREGALFVGTPPCYDQVTDMIAIPRCPKPILSDYFYKFLIGPCGSIAHYNKEGWVAKYPTIKELKAFFARNELGKRVVEWIPPWYTDALKIAEEMERRLDHNTLSPLRSYLKAKG